MSLVWGVLMQIASAALDQLPVSLVWGVVMQIASAVLDQLPFPCVGCINADCVGSA